MSLESLDTSFCYVDSVIVGIDKLEGDVVFCYTLLKFC